MRERIKKWFVKVFMTKYIIIRNGVILWQLFYPDRTEIKYTLAPSDLLSELSLLKDFEFSRIIKKAYLSNGLMSFLIIRFLIKKHGKKYRYRRLRAKDVVYVTDLTGLNRN